jgi:hypothetical protein
VQLTPIADILAAEPLTSTELAQPLSHYLAVLAQTPASDRELQAMDDFHHIRSAMHGLVAREVRSGVVPTPVILSYRAFLVASAKQVPCADVTANWKELVDDFNAIRAEAGVGDAVSALVLADMDRAATGGETAVLQILPDDSRFMNTGRKLTDLFETTHGASDWKADDTTGWESELSELLNQIDEFDPSKEQCADCAYLQKSQWLFGAFIETPDGSYREKVLADLVRSLATSPLQATQRTLWLDRVKWLLNLARTPTKEQTAELDEMQNKNRESAVSGRPVSSAMAEKIRWELKRSGNNTIYVYVEAEELFRFPYFSPYASCTVDCH